MFNSFLNSIFMQLLTTRLITEKHELIAKLINISIWALCTLFVSGYVLQAFGLSGSFGPFQLAGVIATIGLFEVYGNCVGMLVDFSGDRSIDYYLTLPTTPRVVFASIATSFALIGTIMSFAMLPLGKVILYNSFDMTNIAWIKFLLITILGNVFFGLLTLAIGAQVGSIPKMGNIWARFIFPMWFLGGFQFSWAAIHKLSAPLSYVILCNPVIYIMEGTRAAVLGQHEYISWWYCIGILTVFSSLCALYAYHKMKKLLDFV